MKNKFTYFINLYIVPLFYILWILILSGCATTQPIAIDSQKVQAPIDIMKDCEEFIYPDDSSLKSFAKALYDNKKVYLLCSQQNQSKKEFILNISK